MGQEKKALSEPQEFNKSIQVSVYDSRLEWNLHGCEYRRKITRADFPGRYRDDAMCLREPGLSVEGKEAGIGSRKSDGR